jgi:2-amino-4-hydroxy-6-hydroxymethyldihydropteridine diphosphokinase
MFCQGDYYLNTCCYVAQTYRKAIKIPIFVAIGANLPDSAGTPPLQICERAARAVSGLPDLNGAVRSRWFSSAPVPDSDQPRYINGILRLDGKADPPALLAWLQNIEQAAGRMRSERNAARTLDLDIVAMDELVRDAPDPVLPHPRAHLRAFVLLPLRDVAPLWMHPVLGQDVNALIAALPPQDIRPLNDLDWVAQGASAP